MISSLVPALISAFKARRELALENVALRQQLAVIRRSVKRPRLSKVDRGFWVLLRRIWTDWESVLVIVKPETVIRWHRCGFRRYWTWKSRRRRPGRPGVAPEIRELIRNMSRANPLWGAPRVHGELAKLGISISQAAVSRYRVRHRMPPSHTWRSFLDNHVKDLVSLDFFTLPTATFRVLFVFIVLRHERRRIVHFNVTEHPSAEWTAQQMVDAFPWDTAPRYLVRDRDQTYGAYFDSRVDGLGIEQVLTAPRSPWQNPFVERMIGSIRRECLDHVIVLDERHLKRILRKYVDYYHSCRTHLSLEKDAPEPRRVESPAMVSIIIINPGLDSRARTALEHMLESVVSARGKVLRTNFSATSRVNASDQADSGCLSPLVSMVQSTDSRQCDYFRRRRRSVRDRSQARCVLVQPQVATVVMIVADLCRVPDYAA